MAENNSFVMYESYYNAVRKLEETNPEAAYKLICAIVEYGLYGEYDESDPLVAVTMESIGYNIDRSKGRYEKAVADGSLGGRKPTFDAAAMVEMRKSGMKIKDIAAACKCSEKTVQRALKAAKTETKIEIETKVGDDGKLKYVF